MKSGCLWRTGHGKEEGLETAVCLKPQNYLTLNYLYANITLKNIQIKK